MIIKAESNGNYDPAPAGNHKARCVSIIDLGTQEINWQGQIKYQKKVRITWELPEETKVFKEENGEQPYLLSKVYTISLGEKANLRKDLESWRGAALTQQELNAFELESILDKPCMLQVIHREYNDKMYANISSVAGLPKGVTMPERITDLKLFELKNPDQKVFDSLSDFIKEKIKKSPEYQTTGYQEDDRKYVENTEEKIPF